MAEHVFAKGDCLFTIADKAGFPTIDPIWKHARNRELASNRQPGMLLEGDRIFIPPIQEKTSNYSTGATHQVTVKSVPAYLRLCMKDGDGKPLANQPYKLQMGSVLREGTTDGNGILEQKVPLPTTNMVLHFAGRKIELTAGRLGPFTGERPADVIAAQSRLRNLGYRPGPLDGIAGKRTRAAVVAFQTGEGIEVTGKLDAATIDKLKQEYGR